MSFCQKHTNHHCVHSHKCDNKQHQALRKKKLKEQKDNVGKQSHECIKSMRQVQNKCSFQSSHTLKRESLEQNQECKTTIAQLLRNQIALKDKAQKLSHENKHLYTQIQYYRQQFSYLIGTNANDGKNQIKKHLKQTTQLILQIKQLKNQNSSLLNENAELKNAIQILRSKGTTFSALKQGYEQKSKDIYHKFKIISQEKNQLSKIVQSNKREYDQLLDRYEILKKQCEKNCQKNQKNVTDLKNELSVTNKQKQKIHNKLIKQNQIFKIEQQKSKKIQILLKQKIDHLESINKQKIKQIKELQQKCENLHEDFQHSKRLLQKFTASNEQYKQIKSNMQQKDIQAKTIIKQSGPSSYQFKQNYQKENKQNNFYQQTANYANSNTSNQSQVKQLKAEIDRLKRTIHELQSGSTKHIEEIIMNMGASEAYRRLLEQKNTIIKRLMRQKGQILLKVPYNHV